MIAHGSGRTRIIVIRPEQPRNLGALVRAAANFEAEGVWMVSDTPLSADQEREVRVAASGAWEVTGGVRHTTTLSEAAAGCDLLAGTSARARKGASPPLTPAQFFGRHAHLSLVGIVFGPESQGLTGSDLEACHALIRIPSSPRFPSLNLAQAVLLILYEGAQNRLVSSPPPAAEEKAAPLPLQERFLDRLEQQMKEKHKTRSAPLGAPQATAQLRRLLHRARPTEEEIYLLLNLLKP